MTADAGRTGSPHALAHLMDVETADRTRSANRSYEKRAPKADWTRAPIFDRVLRQALHTSSSRPPGFEDPTVDLRLLEPGPALFVDQGYCRPAYPELASVMKQRVRHPGYALPQPEVRELMERQAAVEPDKAREFWDNVLRYAPYDEDINGADEPAEEEAQGSGSDAGAEDGPESEDDGSEEEEYRERPFGLRRLRIVKAKPAAPPPAPTRTKKGEGKRRLGRASPSPEDARSGGITNHWSIPNDMPLSVGRSSRNGHVLGKTPEGVLKKERVLMCGMPKPGDESLTCGIYATHFHDLYRHRIVHMMWETLMREQAALAHEELSVEGLVFGGFEGAFPKCKRCDKQFARYDSLQRHEVKTRCKALSAAEKKSPELRRQRLTKEIRKSEALQHWIPTRVPRPKVAVAKVAYPTGTRAYRDVVILELYEVQETYAARYQVVTVKAGKEYQVKLFNEDEPGGTEFYARQKEKVQLKQVAMAEWNDEGSKGINSEGRIIRVGLDGAGQVKRVV